MFLTLADALHLRFMNGINLFTTMTPLCKNCPKSLNEFIVKAVFSKITLKFSD